MCECLLPILNSAFCRQHLDRNHKGSGMSPLIVLELQKYNFYHLHEVCSFTHNILLCQLVLSAEIYHTVVYRVNKNSLKSRKIK
jgi:hypothetical protein